MGLTTEAIHLSAALELLPPQRQKRHDQVSLRCRRLEYKLLGLARNPATRQDREDFEKLMAEKERIEAEALAAAELAPA